AARSPLRPGRRPSPARRQPAPAFDSRLRHPHPDTRTQPV
ncbi:hypothetical protein, partial [Pseudomonas sp. FEN]